jgi:protein SCO1/2
VTSAPLRPRLCLPTILAAICAAATPGRAQDRTDALPEGLAGIGIDEQLNARLPLDLEFVDHSGRKVRLRDYFDGKRPVILTLNYYGCPSLCGYMLNGMVDAMKDIDWAPGGEYRIVTLSFDPAETSQLAQAKRRNYLEAYGRPVAADGWVFLTGRRDSIRPLLEATGYHTRWDESTRQWAHSLALIVCTPDGRISRYLYGVIYQPKTLRLALLEAAEGKIGSTVDRALFYCYHYEDGQYSLAVMKLMRVAGVLTMLVVGVFLAVLWRREKRHAAAGASNT